MQRASLRAPDLGLRQSPAGALSRGLAPEEARGGQEEGTAAAAAAVAGAEGGAAVVVVGRREVQGPHRRGRGREAEEIAAGKRGSVGAGRGGERTYVQ